MTWKDRARKISKGKFIKFSAEEPVHILTFIGEPVEREMESTLKGKEGDKYTCFDFPVLEDEEERILGVTQKGLLRQLIEEDDVEPLVGRTLMIKCLDPVKKTNWMIRPIQQQAEVQKWSEKPADEKKEKFLKEVKKRTAKKKEAEENGDQGSSGEEPSGEVQ